MDVYWMEIYEAVYSQGTEWETRGTPMCNRVTIRASDDINHEQKENKFN